MGKLPVGNDLSW
ncbi:unnamed protein product, partial [Rotaria magnacalcarata]